MGSPLSSGDLRITRDPETGAVTFLRSRQGLDSGVSLRTLPLNPAAAVLDGGEGVIHNTDAIISFLRDYAKQSSGALRLLANKVRREIEASRASGDPFLKFRLN
jgi:hypothetical protein